MSRPKKNSHKLTVEQVLDIRLRYAVGDRRWTKIGRLYGVKADAVRNAAWGVPYKDLPMPPGWRS
ncbi:hypothetical protein [Microvirga mediterraneensis]|uniref:Uncharacterized protein n=1 Tax=Microvirga mediterraneensis TaxID=2754695 RepID=A0A838BPT1_9HYPH|nr:hypothetical protein [Microvirga mediterraneensis]MBA1156943.1 hypothetical protein [Microvirga mediterraneensis]